MLHSIKYKIPAIVVKTRDEAIADRRQQLIDQVLANRQLNAHQKMRLFESALSRKLADEPKISYEPMPTVGEVDIEPADGTVIDADEAIEDDDAVEEETAVEEDIRTAIEADEADEGRRESIAYTYNTPNKRLKSGFIPVHLPGYMQPLKRDSPVSSRLRENRPPAGHFTGLGRLRVVRW